MLYKTIFLFIHLFAVEKYISWLVSTNIHKNAEILSPWFFVTLTGLQKTFDNSLTRGFHRMKFNTGSHILCYAAVLYAKQNEESVKF